ncbi:MAG: FadR family transcriptional regulator [Proteobacteria bacterium]|nr:FadR family transcriptional regulator [Pseudomonadota bacterium]MBU1450181.1 FadR family transcriptional regulator [Pseudomonadota bacterium]MBU2468909.1 FadR family transcriptional regulator [Pseudomonadota bacterium]MBU2517228.1 FadR family transcriptional regulator [Pseudomonadota bacterium]
MNQESSKASQQIFTPVKNKRTFEEVSGNIKELILDGTLKVGDRLPPETQLAQQFNVGRQTIREALRLLELSGFITVQRGGGGGTIIKDTILRRISDLFIDAFRMRRVGIEAITQARLEVERIILDYALTNAGPEDVKKLRANVAQAQKQIKAGRLATEANAQFHGLLAKATGNPVFVMVLESIMAVHLDFLTRVPASLETSKKVVKAHEQILGAIEKGDRQLAQSLLESHLTEVRERLHQVDQEEA